MKRLFLCFTLIVFSYFSIVSNANASSLGLGGKVDGFYDPVAGPSVHDFTAYSGDEIVLNFTDSLSNLTAGNMTIKTPSGVILREDVSGLNIFTATESGNYTIEVGNANAQFTYTLSYANPTYAYGFTLMSGYSEFSGEIDKGNLETRNFYGISGSRAYFGLTGPAQIRLYYPDGNILTTVNQRGVINLPESGTYRIVIVPRNLLSTPTSEFNFYYASSKSANENGLLVENSTKVNNFSKNDIDSYTININAGNGVKLSNTGNTGRAMWLYNPQGIVEEFGYNKITKNNLTQSGIYTLIMRSRYTGHVGDYSISYEPIINSIPNTSSPINENYSALQECNSANQFVGNPINFAAGFKVQREMDYQNGKLNLIRTYRSDANWLNDKFGAFWFNHYYRELTFPSSSEVELIDKRSTVLEFIKNGSDWEIIDSDYPAELIEIYDNATLTGYKVITVDDAQEFYNLNGLLTRIEYRAGQALDFEYNGSNSLITVTDERGLELNFNYISGNISSVTTPDGSYIYNYDSNNNLISVTKPDNEIITYHYEDSNFVNALTGITDENGNRISTFGYDNSGRANSTSYAGGINDYSITYNSDGSVTTTNPLGKDTTYHFETILGVNRIVEVEGHASANCAAANKYYTYDSNGWLETTTDWEGNLTSYLYDNGKLLSKTIGYGSDAEKTISYQYDHGYDFRLPSSILENGKTENITYDSSGRILSRTVVDNSSIESRSTTYTYHTDIVDSNGNTILGKIATVTDPKGNITSYDYDSNYRLIKVTNALGHETETTSFDSAGRALTIEDSNNVVTTLTYDVLGRLLTSSKSGSITSYTYNDVGNIETVTLPNNVTMTYGYDIAHRLTNITDGQGNSITYTLDAASNTTSTSYKDPNNILHYSHSQVYDELSRIIESTDANSNTTSYAYDLNSNMTNITDGNYNQTAYDFDALNRLVEETDALYGVTSYSINELDQTEGVTDPRLNTTSYSYNAFGDVIQEISPDRGTVTYTHDANGNILTRTDARNVTITYSYDALDRITNVSYSDSSLNQTFTYDSPTGCGYSIGKLCERTDAGGTVNYSYDALGRLDTVTETRGSLSFVTSYNYDAAGVLTGITLPSGRNINYTINSIGQVSDVNADINSSSSTLASSITYLPFGGLETLTYGNSVILTNSYNTAYELTSKQHGSLFYSNYTYDNAGNITATSFDSYGFDALYRLTTENSDSYTYDAIGNRLSDPSFSYTYPSTSSILTDIGANPITSDAAGNITEDITREYTYDDAGHISSIDISSTTVGTYIYDANNQRVTKTTPSDTIHYVYGLDGLLYGEYDATGNLIREYVYLNGEPLAQIDNISSSDVITYLHTDHLGTPRIGSNASGVNVWAWDSDAFGNGTPSGTATVTLRFAGQYFDSESNLHYNWNRYYDPETGRYISSDPIGLDGGLNTFAYVGVNPVMYTDPEGLSADYWSEGFAYGCRNGVYGCSNSNVIPCTYCTDEYYECTGGFIDRSLDAGSCGVCALSRGSHKQSCAECVLRGVKEAACRAAHCGSSEKKYSWEDCKPPKDNVDEKVCYPEEEF